MPSAGLITISSEAAAALTMGATGCKNDMGKLRMDLVPPEAIDALATVLTYGATKYGDRNWEKGLCWGRVFAALMRHLWLWWSGEENDKESGISHLDHAMCNIAFLIAYSRRRFGQHGIDDRPKKAE